MLVVETIAKIRRAHFVDGKSIKQICRELRVSRNTVRKVIRSGATEFTYDRTTQPRPKIDPWRSDLDAMLAENARRPKRERLTVIRIYEELRNRGYGGGYDAIRRYAAGWSKVAQEASASAYVPLSFDAGEAYQFDWSHEIVILDGVTVTVKVAHVRLCHSRMPFVRAYPRETQEMVFDAHDRAFAFFGGACARGIYDNMKTAVDTIFVGKDRAYNRRFQQMCGHYLVDPVACTPASGWEKGQVENQVGVLRRRFFVPRPKFKSFAELNAWLGDRCIAYAKANRHPDIPDKTIWEVFEEERSSLVPYVGPFDGFHAVPASVSKTCLVRFDKNRYSVDARAVGRPVEIRAYADRLECWQDGQVVGRHERAFGRGKTIYDPLHYIPVLARKPGALRNGAPFKDWDLPPACAGFSASSNASPAATGRWSRSSGRAHRRAGGRRSRLLRGFGPQRPFRRRRSEHPGASPRTATAPDNHDAGCTEVGPRARGQLRSLRQPEENREWNDHRCWTPWVS